MDVLSLSMWHTHCVLRPVSPKPHVWVWVWVCVPVVAADVGLPACRCCEWVALQPAVRQPAGCSAAVGGVWHLCVLVGGVSCRCNRRRRMIGHPCQQQLCMLPAWWLAQQPSWVPPTSCVLVCGKARVETSAVSAVCRRHVAIREGTLCHCDSSTWADMDGGAASLNICIHTQLLWLLLQAWLLCHCWLLCHLVQVKVASLLLLFVLSA